MRKLATLENREELNIFKGYLYYRGIETFNYEDEGDLNLWVVKDSDQEKAKSFFLEFQKVYLRKESSESEIEKLIKNSNLGTAKFQLDERLASEKEKQNQTIDMRVAIVSHKQKFHFLSVTGFLIFFSVIVFFFANSYDTAQKVYGLFTLSRFPREIFFLFEVQNGEIWRLLTPIFLHGSFFHILFNMMWLYQIGTLIENKEGSFFFGILIFTVAALSNFVFYIVVGPNFGGMSGVVYGLVGYLWAYRKIAPASQYFLDDGLIRFFFIWYIFCLFLNLVSSRLNFGMSIANTVHGMGAFVGILMGAFRASRKEKNFLSVSKFFSREGIKIFGILFLLLLGGVLVDMLIKNFN